MVANTRRPVPVVKAKLKFYKIDYIYIILVLFFLLSEPHNCMKKILDNKILYESLISNFVPCYLKKAIIEFLVFSFFISLSDIFFEFSINQFIMNI